jgi:DNA-binding CsgD family transcriptional regulator
MDAEADPVDREAALHRMADRIPWSPRRNPRVWPKLIARAKQDDVRVAAVAHSELCAGLLLALGDTDRPQTHRFGREWLKSEDGKRATVAPDDLTMDYFWDWLFDEAINRAEAALLDEPYPRPSSDAMERGARDESEVDILTLRDDRADPLLLLLEDEERREDAKRLLSVLERATGQQRQLLALIAQGRSLSEAAKDLGIKPATARVQMHRLRRVAM